MRNLLSLPCKIYGIQNFPDYIFEYSFLDQSIARLLQTGTPAFNTLQNICRYCHFYFLSWFIWIDFVYGVQRKKEIGIRKVLGAPVRDIVIMLSGEFTILISNRISYCFADCMVFYASMAAAIYVSYLDGNVVFCGHHFMLIIYCMDYGGIYCNKSSNSKPCKEFENGII